ncbi:YcaO-like family protein (plasmid) [Haloimpatiens sp. FM7330]|uniref:YcaO-like family protein n=1 Tax=Haloimpatiens sp. FM7330 TaxID=3298610 RepID=UPI00362EC51A
MFNSVKRPYKNLNPEETLNKIKNILEEVDLIPHEVFKGNPYPQIYSTRIELDESKGSFGTNGKGRTREYALASGYAEFMERIQNNWLVMFSRTIMSKIKKKQGFYFTPDEKYLKKEEFLNLPNEIMEDILKYRSKSKTEFVDSYFERLHNNNVEGIVSIPFYDTKNKKLIYLPINLLTIAVGSNGMAAGNTVPEAIFQGMCELMERWGAAETFYNQITPPTVPDEFLKRFSEEYEIINNIEKNGKFKIIVKDFSANKKIPSIGVIIINKETNKYRLNVGSDTSFQIALSRCLTEIYQGIESEDKFNESLLDIPKEIPSYFENNHKEDTYKRYEEFTNFTVDGSGTFPPSLFEEKEDYAFDSTVFIPKESYKEEVKAMISNLYNRGYNVYIRDNSYLGFPSIMVYVPEVSAFGRKNINKPVESTKFNQIELDKIENLFFNFDNCSEEEMNKIEKALSDLNYTAVLGEIFNVNFKKNSPYNQFNVAFFLTQLRYRLGKYEQAVEALEAFKNNRQQQDLYYDIVTQYFKLKESGMNSEDIFKKILNMDFPKEEVSQVCEDLKNPKDVFKYIALPKCPNCDTCKLKDECLTTAKINVENKLRTKMKENPINQITLEWVS